jgi:hypothetical protein
LIETSVIREGSNVALAALELPRRERVLTQVALSELTGLRNAYLLAWAPSAEPQRLKPVLFITLKRRGDAALIGAEVVAKLRAVFGDAFTPDVIPFGGTEAYAQLVRQLGVRVYPSGLAYLARWHVVLAIVISLAILILWTWRQG